MHLTLRGFLVARLVAVAAWILWLALAFLLAEFVGAQISGDIARWFARFAVLAAAIGLGVWLQRRALVWLDPEGELRRQAGQQR
ncbi:MAG: hypothetical protein LWW86_02445 [Micrococcales bacterium]|nr:hypothetical protein [Micrococcales bacterium]